MHSLRRATQLRYRKVVPCFALVVVAGLAQPSGSVAAPRTALAPAPTVPPTRVTAPTTRVGDLVAAARAQIGRTTLYDPAYVGLAYPGGDVPIERGVCTDVLIRAFRSVGIDLQVLVHEDMVRRFSSYPKTSIRKPDSNIDHRRVKNLVTFFNHSGAAVPVTTNDADYAAGDIVMWKVGGLDHTGLMADTKAAGTDRLLVVHNIGNGTQMEDILFQYPIVGHFRYLGPSTAATSSPGSTARRRPAAPSATRGSARQ
jgi:uncharacterized protein